MLFAVLFAYLLEPVVCRIEGSMLAKGLRWLAILETYLAIGAILTALGILFGPKLVEDDPPAKPIAARIAGEGYNRKDRLAIW